MLPEVEGKKIYVDDFLVGTIKQLTYDDVGNHIVIVETVFEEYPEFTIEVVKLKRIKKDGEDAFTLKGVPVKLKELIEQKKLEEEMKKAEEEVAGEEIPIIEEEQPEEKSKEEKMPPPPPPKKKSILRRIIDFFMRLFRREKKAKPEQKEQEKNEKASPDIAEKSTSAENPQTELQKELKEALAKKPEDKK